jgi:hypothetical protein
VVKEEGAWRTLGKPFIENAWPRERRLQTSATSSQLAELARAAGDDFPDAVKTVLPLLVPLGQADMFLHETPEDAADPATPRLYRKFPEAYLAMLDRLIARDTRSAPYGLSPIVRELAQAEPRLRQNPSWRRLNELIARG